MTTPRDASAIQLRCPHCKTTGLAYLVSGEPNAKDVGREDMLWWVPKGFRVSKDRGTALLTEFRCTHCDEVAG